MYTYTYTYTYTYMLPMFYIQLHVCIYIYIYMYRLPSEVDEYSREAKELVMLRHLYIYIYIYTQRSLRAEPLLCQEPALILRYMIFISY